MMVSGYVLDNASGQIRAVRDDDSRAVHDAITKARGIHLMTHPVVFSNGTIMGEMIRMADETASVVIARDAKTNHVLEAVPVEIVTEVR